MSAVFDEKIHTTLADGKLQLAIYAATGRLIEKRRKAITPDVCPDYQDLRAHANAVKRHTINHLDYYL
jgi:L-lactate dehydrogenase complex protein LldF